MLRENHRIVRFRIYVLTTLTNHRRTVQYGVHHMYKKQRVETQNIKNMMYIWCVQCTYIHNGCPPFFAQTSTRWNSHICISFFLHQISHVLGQLFVCQADISARRCSRQAWQHGARALGVSQSSCAALPCRVIAPRDESEASAASQTVLSSHPCTPPA